MITATLKAKIVRIEAELLEPGEVPRIVNELHPCLSEDGKKDLDYLFSHAVNYPLGGTVESVDNLNIRKGDYLIVYDYNPNIVLHFRKAEFEQLFQLNT